MTDQDIKQIYKKFTKKDMNFEAFRREIKKLTDPVRFQADLEAIKIEKMIRKGM